MALNVKMSNSANLRRNINTAGLKKAKTAYVQLNGSTVPKTKQNVVIPRNMDIKPVSGTKTIRPCKLTNHCYSTSLLDPNLDKNLASML